MSVVTLYVLVETPTVYDLCLSSTGICLRKIGSVKLGRPYQPLPQLGSLIVLEPKCEQFTPKTRDINLQGPQFKEKRSKQAELESAHGLGDLSAWLGGSGVILGVAMDFISRGKK